VGSAFRRLVQLSIPYHLFEPHRILKHADVVEQAVGFSIRATPLQQGDQVLIVVTIPVATFTVQSKVGQFAMDRLALERVIHFCR
jgi:hypothetical protein